MNCLLNSKTGSHLLGWWRGQKASMRDASTSNSSRQGNSYSRGLMRRAVEVAPKRKGVPPQHLLALSLNTAVRGIELFSGLFEMNAIAYTRSYFSFLFTAGLSIMLSASYLMVPSKTATMQAQARRLWSHAKIHLGGLQRSCQTPNLT